MSLRQDMKGLIVQGLERQKFSSDEVKYYAEEIFPQIYIKISETIDRLSFISDKDIKDFLIELMNNHELLFDSDLNTLFYYASNINALKEDIENLDDQEAIDQVRIYLRQCEEQLRLQKQSYMNYVENIIKERADSKVSDFLKQLESVMQRFHKGVAHHNKKWIHSELKKNLKSYSNEANRIYTDINMLTNLADHSGSWTPEHLSLLSNLVQQSKNIVNQCCIEIGARKDKNEYQGENVKVILGLLSKIWKAIVSLFQRRVNEATHHDDTSSEKLLKSNSLLLANRPTPDNAPRFQSNAK